MSSATLLSAAEKLSESIALADEQIGELREQIASFQGSGDLALPADFDIDAATAELAKLLKQRHADNTKLRDLSEKLDATRKQETARELKRLTEEHKDACKAVLAAEIALARAYAKERKPRLEAAALVGGICGPLTHFGLGGHQSSFFDVDDGNSILAHHVREAVKEGYIRPDDKLLDGVQF